MSQTKQLLARQILDHRNSRFAFVSPTGGSARAGLEALAAGRKAYVAATGGYTDVDVRILAALWTMCQHGVVYVNCLTNGRHMVGSRHYIGKAIDIDNVSSAPVEADAAKFGGQRNSETTHKHLDWWNEGGLPDWFHVEPPDPLRVLLKDEHDWVREYVKLAKANKNLARRKKLRKKMRSRMKGIERKAHSSGWNRENRRLRWHLLRRYGK